MHFAFKKSSFVESKMALWSSIPAEKFIKSTSSYQKLEIVLAFANYFEI